MFLDSLDLRKTRKLDRDTGLPSYRVVKPLRWDMGDGTIITVPADYLTDGPSYPWWLRWALWILWKWVIRPAVLHDFLYSNQGGYRAPIGKSGIKLDRRQCDKLFRDALLLEGLPKPLAWLHFKAVRTEAGELAWQDDD